MHSAISRWISLVGMLGDDTELNLILLFAGSFPQLIGNQQTALGTPRADGQLPMGNYQKRQVGKRQLTSRSA